MSHSRKAPSLTFVAGTAVSPAPRKRRPPTDREAQAIAAGKIIEAILPAYVELHRAWAKGSSQAHTYGDANFTEEQRYEGSEGVAHKALKAICHSTGADLAQKGMSAIFPKIAALTRQIHRAPVQTIDGLRAKALAALWECIPAIGSDRSFDFTDERTFEMLFRACLSVTGLSVSGAAIEKRLQLDDGGKQP
jgi:hypothetical protein